MIPDPDMSRSAGDWPPAARARAFAVHILTAFGAALALLALLAATRGEWTLMFLWLGVALLVDACDGPLARRFEVQAVLPRWSGDALDFVVDFLTYVFVPAYALSASGLLSDGMAVPLSLMVVVSGAFYFADRNMKLAGNYFRGFPVLWNAVVFYLFVFRLPEMAAAACVIAFIVLTFVPFRFIHPVRVRRWRLLNFVALALWSVLGALALWQKLDVDTWIKIGLSVSGLYFCLMGILPHTQDSNDV